MSQAAALSACVATLAPAAAATPADVTPPQRLDAEPVPYPVDGRGDAIVVLAVVVDDMGAVRDAAVRTGDAPFAEAAAVAVRRWRFAPARRDDVAIAARIVVNVAFHAPLEKPASPPSAQPPQPPLAPSRPVTPPPVAEVSVRGEREEPSTVHVARTDTRFVPGAFGDPFRVVEALPGMAPWLSGLPYYYVRGSAPENVGYFIDGIPVPLLFHVGAGPSTIAPALVDSVDLFPGAYPASLGRYAGATIAGEITPPAADHSHTELQARVFDASAFSEVPFDDGRGAVLLAGRYAYTGLLTSLIVPNYKVGYWDYQLRASHRLGDRDTLSLFVFGSHDELEYKGQQTFDVEYHRADLRYDHPTPDGRVRVAGTLRYDDTRTALQTDDGAGSQAALRGAGARVRTEIEQRVAPGARLRAGADIGVMRFSEDDYPADPTVGFPGLSGAHTDVEGGLYGDIVWRPSRQLELVPGLRFDGYRTRGRTTWAPQPRLSARLQITPSLSWVSAFGVAHQEPTEEVFVPAKLPDPIDEASRTSAQLSEGLDARLPGRVRGRITAFASRMFAADVPGTQPHGEVRGEGVEVFAQRSFSERLGVILSYTLSRSDRTLGASSARSPSDRTHLFSLVIGYDLGGGFRAGTRFFVESGRPFTRVCETPRCSPGFGSASYEVSGELPVFYRIDARFEKRWELGHGSWITATLEGFNVTAQSEPIGVSYDPATGLQTVRQSAIILPSVGIEAGF